MEDTVYTTYMTSPLGRIVLRAKNERIIECTWADSSADLAQEARNHLDADRPCESAIEVPQSDEPPCLVQARLQLEEYFAGNRQLFSCPISINGTAFQMAVWSELSSIPYGTTISYSTLASRLGNAKAVRAVAQACHRNPIAIIIPCHRVIGADGSMTGYAGGIERKARLIEMEQRGGEPKI